EDHIAALRVLSHLIHRGGIDRAPAVDQRDPVWLDAAFLRPFGEIRNQARAPVDHGAEHIEHQRLCRRNIGHVCSLLLLNVVILGCAPARTRKSRAETSGFRVRSLRSHPGMTTYGTNLKHLAVLDESEI